MRKHGLFIVIEGSDGSGKATQLNLLKERLKAIGHDVAVFDFPRYDKQSSYFVQKYLNGEYGPASKISPYTASLFYALDRFEAVKDISKALEQGKIVISNRYAGSNMAHQGAKFRDPVEQRGFFVWADNLEFQMLNIPRPDINIYLRVPAEVSYDLIGKKNTRTYTSKSHDEHEADINHLKKAIATFDLLCELFPKDFKAIECTKDGQLMSIPQISNLIWRYLQSRLPEEKPNPSHSVIITLGLNEVKPTVGHHVNGKNTLEIPFKNASLLLRLEMERALTGQTTPLINSWADCGYDFFTPNSLPSNVEKSYRQSLSKLTEIHKAVRDGLSAFFEKTSPGNGGRSLQSVDEIMLQLTPLSAITDFSLTLNKAGVIPLAGRLLAGDGDEADWAAKQLYLIARQNWPQDFKNSLESVTPPESINNIIAKLADETLPHNSTVNEPVKLLEASPRQEFDLLAESIYPFSSLSLDEITDEVSDWPYPQKYDSLRQAAAQPGILSKVQYKMDIISDQLTIDQLSRAAGLKFVQVQAFTPRYGYDVPEIIEQAGLDDIYDSCFDESLKLFSLLQAAGFDHLAGYATLMGHRSRWQLNSDAEKLLWAIKAGSASHYGLIAHAIAEKASETHPLLWEIMSGRPAEIAFHKNGRQRVKPAHQRAKRKPHTKK